MAIRITKVKRNLKGIREVLKSPPLQDVVEDILEEWAEEAGEGFEYEMKPHDRTARGYLQMDTSSAAAHAIGRRRQAREHVIQQVIGKKR